ncbi:MAG: glycosyltransferase [Candidatus Altiarchaeota archaeon]
MIEEILLVLFSFMIVLYSSWLILFFTPRRRAPAEPIFPPVSVILPAHNEAGIIRESIQNALDSDYDGVKEVIVVDDGSTDDTAALVKQVMSSDSRLNLISLDHGGKSNAINTALNEAKGEIVVVVDADSKLNADALVKLVAPFSDERVGAVSGVIRAIVNNNILVWFQDLEYLMSSTWRLICDKLDSTYLLPGFTAFRKSALIEIGGFTRDTLSEDFEVGLRLRKAGYRMLMADAVMYTHVPQDIKSLLRQRFRWGRGTIQVVKKHSDVPFNPQYGAIGFYGIPTQLYWFIHGFIALPISLYQITNGYIIYFAKYSDYLSFSVLKYFFGWISLYGMVEYSYNTLTGVYPMTTVFIFCFTSFLLGLSYNLLSILRWTRITWRHLLAIFFFFPYSIMALIAFITPLILELNPFSKRKENINIWEK